MLDITRKRKRTIGLELQEDHKSLLESVEGSEESVILQIHGKEANRKPDYTRSRRDREVIEQECPT